jgi:hypothetical protein
MKERNRTKEVNFKRSWIQPRSNTKITLTSAPDAKIGLTSKGHCAAGTPVFPLGQLYFFLQKMV